MSSLVPIRFQEFDLDAMAQAEGRVAIIIPADGKMNPAARRASALAGHFKPFDARMGKALKALEAQPGDERLHKAVAGLVQEYRKLLDTEFFRAVDDNGFAKTGIRSALIRPLDQINQALAS